MKHVVLRAVLQAPPTAADFVVCAAPVPACPAGGVLAQVLFLSLDPYVGARLRGRHMGEPPPSPNVEPIPGAVVGRVLESDAVGIAPGDFVHSMMGAWGEVVAIGPGMARRIDPELAPLSAYLGVLGMPGLTAWAGATKLAKVGSGDVALVNAAAGAVGGSVGQIARLKGAERVIGIAGGPEKCGLVVDRYGLDACVDYKASDWPSGLDAALGGRGVSVHFENVSAAMLAAGMSRLSPYGRVVLCGLADHYQAETGSAQIPIGLIIVKRAQVHGLVVYDFYDQWDAFLREAAPWVRDGRLRIAEDVATGLDNAPAHFEKLMQGRNVGKSIVVVNAE
jgi:NADPH-dependent curcumin reductase